MISCHGAVARRLVTTRPIASASFIAGMTTETAEVSAKELLDDAVPRDGARAHAAGAAKPPGQRPVAREAIDGRRNRLRLPAAHRALARLVPSEPRIIFSGAVT